MKNQIYTFGYSNGTARDTVEHMIGEMQYLFVDLRLSPYSRWQPAWNRVSLEHLWEEQYLWLGRSLGNMNYKDPNKSIRLVNTEEGLRVIEGALIVERVPVLFCTCKDYEKCHRKVVVELLKERIPGLMHQELGENIDVSNQGSASS